MRRQFWGVCIVLLMCGGQFARAQEGLNLPAELYILLNTGVIERYGLGASGVETITSADEFILDFRVAPDNTWLAYRTLSGLFLLNMYDQTQRRSLENADSAGVPQIRGKGETIAWSPQGDALAYTTLTGGRVYFFESNTFVALDAPNLQHLLWSPDGRYLAAAAQENVWWIFSRQANQMTLISIIPEGISATWVGLTQMVFAPPSGGLVLMDIAAANQQTALLAPDFRYQLLYSLENNTLMAFRLNPDGTLTGKLVQVAITETSAQAAEIGATEIDLTDVQWALGGQLLIAFQGGVLALQEPYSGSGFALPTSSAAAYGWGVPQPAAVEGVGLPTEGYFLAPSVDGVVQVWRLPRDGSLPATITPAAQDITEYAIAPRGQRLAYVSNGALWSYTLGNLEGEMLVELGINQAIEPVFAPDERTIYYRDQQGDQDALWAVDFTNGKTRQIVGSTAARRYFSPRPAGGVAALAVAWEESGAGSGFTLFDSNSGEQLFDLLTANEGGFFRAPEWLNGSQLLFGGTIVRGGVPIAGLHVLDANNLTEPPFTVLPLDTALQIWDIVPINRTTLRALTQSRTPGSVNILDIPLEGGTASLIGSAGFLYAPRLAPDGSMIIGAARPNGALIVYTPADNSRVRLQDVPNMTHFQWR